MILTPKHFFRLRKELAEKITSDISARKYCESAGISVLKVRFNLSPWEWWNDILEIALQKQDTALNLLQKILVDHQENETFNFYHDEIKSSRQLRLIKLAEAFNKGKCVVFLGPDVLKVRDKDTLITFNDMLCKKLATDMENNYIYFDSDLACNASYLAQCYADDVKTAPGEVAAIAAGLYKDYVDQGLVDEGVYNELAKLPLRLIINANPDDLLYRKLNENNSHTCVLKYYDISNSAVSADASTSEPVTPPPGNGTVIPKVLQYNIFGIFSKENSILYTESQFLNFINSVILGNPRLDADVQRELEDQENYLFLGFDFEQWYFKILFQLFKIKKVQYASISCGFEQPDEEDEEKSSMSVYNREFFEQEFKMFFVNDDIRKFLTELRKTIQKEA